mmetsp:Transcript_19027/g.52859  ORF Transcript_19027/g.52859 Transcript_19027/m.52859 type:complete len:1285 (+) Transcript_19027:81-3935(+)
MSRVVRPVLGGRQRSPSPLARQQLSNRARASPRAGQGAAVEAKEAGDVQTLPLPGPLEPDCVVRPQGSAVQHTFTAMHGEAVACLSGACAVMCYTDKQDVLSGSRMRQLSCCALSPDSHFLACGEVPSQDGPRPLSTQILVFNVRDLSVKPLRGQARGTKLVSWSKQAEKTFLLSVSFPDSDNKDGDHLVLWSWPQGERLASAVCLSGVTHISFAPETLAFSTATTHEVKVWSVVPPMSSRGRGASTCWQLTNRPVAADFGVKAARTWSVAETAVASIAWGAAAWLYVLSHSGRLCAKSITDHGASPKCFDLGRRANVVIWADRLCGKRPGPLGLLACAMAGGSVEVLNAEDFTSVASINPPEGDIEAVGLSHSTMGEALWVMYSDRMLRCWRNLDKSQPDREMLPPPLGLGCCGTGKAGGLATLVTSSPAGLQHWTRCGSGLKLDYEFEQDAATALAVSDHLVASGHSTGVLRLFALPRLRRLDVRLPGHEAEVLDLSFSDAALPSLLLVSASLDRTVRVLRLDLHRGPTGVVEGCHATSVYCSNANRGIVEFAAFLRSGEASRIVALTGTHQIVYHNVEGICADGAEVLCSTQYPKSCRWAGMCAHPRQTCVFVASADRRIRQLDFNGQIVHQVKIGGPDIEFAPPLRISQLDWECSILAVNLAPAPHRIQPAGTSTTNLAVPDPASQADSASSLARRSIQSRWAHSAGAVTGLAAGLGILLLDASNGLQPLVRLAGHFEAACSMTFLESDRCAACWPDGSVFLWKPSAAEPHGRDTSSSGSSSHTVSVGHPLVAAVLPASASTAAAGAAALAAPPPPTWAAVGGGLKLGARGRSAESPLRARLRSGPSSSGSSLIAAAGLNTKLMQPVRSRNNGTRQAANEVLHNLFASSTDLPGWAQSHCNSTCSDSVHAPVPPIAGLSSACLGLQDTDSRSSVGSASGSGSVIGTSLGIGQQQRLSSGMGMWDHASQVGSRVNSMSDLHNIPGFSSALVDTSMQPLPPPPNVTVASGPPPPPEGDVPMPTLRMQPAGHPMDDACPSIGRSGIPQGGADARAAAVALMSIATPMRASEANGAVRSSSLEVPRVLECPGTASTFRSASPPLLQNGGPRRERRVRLPPMPSMPPPLDPADAHVPSGIAPAGSAAATPKDLGMPCSCGGAPSVTPVTPLNVRLLGLSTPCRVPVPGSVPSRCPRDVASSSSAAAYDIGSECIPSHPVSGRDRQPALSVLSERLLGEVSAWSSEVQQAPGCVLQRTQALRLNICSILECIVGDQSGRCTAGRES